MMIGGGENWENIEQNQFQRNLLYILESNPHPFYSFRGLKKSDAD
jgi:hypothetical protein